MQRYCSCDDFLKMAQIWVKPECKRDIVQMAPERERERERMKCQSKDKKYFCFRRKIIFVETQFYFYRFPSFCPPSYLAPPQQQDSHSHSRSQRQSSSFWKLVRAAVFFWAAEPGFKKVSSALLKDTGYCPVDTAQLTFRRSIFWLKAKPESLEESIFWFRKRRSKRCFWCLRPSLAKDSGSEKRLKNKRGLY